MLLTYLKSLFPVKELSLKLLRYTRVALPAIFSAQRCQTLYFFGHSEHGGYRLHRQVLNRRQTETDQTWQTSS